MPALHRPVARLIALLLLATTLALGSVVSSTTSASADEPRGPQRSADADRRVTTSTITGLVHDPNGELVDNIQVEALAVDDPAGDPVASDLTYEDGDSATHGAYTLHVPAGRYLVRFTTPDWHARAFETLYYGGAAGTPVSVLAGDDKLLEDVTLVRDTGVTVTGTVTGDYAASRVSVDLYRVVGDQFWVVDSTTVAKNGTYAFARVNRGRTYTVAVQGWNDDEDEGPAYPLTFLGEQPVAALASTFAVPAGSTGTTVAAIDVTQGTLVSGTAQRAGGAPVPHVHVEFVAVTPSGRFGLGQQHSDVESGYAQRLLPGTYTVAVYDYEEDGEAVYLGDTPDVMQAETFVVPATGSLTLRPITVVADASLVAVTGTVALSGGAPVPSGTRAQLLVRYDDEDEDGWDSLRETAVGPNGTFALTVPGWAAGYDALSVGIYHEDGEFETTFLGDVTAIEDATTFAAPTTGPTYPVGTITVAARRQSGVTGIVRRDGEPAEGVWVGLYLLHDDWGWDSWSGVRTRADGSYELPVDVGLGSADYSALTVLATGVDGWSETYLGGASQIEEATTADLPGRGETITLDPIDQVRVPGALTGRVLTEDGGSLGEDYQVRSELYRWSDDEWSGLGFWDYVGGSYVDGSPAYYFQDLAPGTYTVRSAHRSYEGTSVYLPTYANGTSTAPAGPGASGTFVVSEDSAPTTGPTISLRRGVALTGTVTGPSGLPLADVDVQASTWAGGELSSPASSTTDEQGRYSIIVPPSSDVFVSTYRSGFLPFGLGGEPWPTEQTEENSLPVGPEGATFDIDLTPDWGQVGTVAGEQLDHCLQHSSYEVEFAGRDLSVDAGSIYADSLELPGRGPVLDVTPDWSSTSHTWGVSDDGQSLCVLFRGYEWEDDSTSVAQALLTVAPGGGFDVTYNYDVVASSPQGSAVGFSEGEGTAGQEVVFPGGDIADGYADTNLATGLVHHARGSDQPGRYRFHYDGFNARGAAPENVARPTVTGSPAYGVGDTLTAGPGTWTLDGDEVPDLALTYRWRRSGGKVLQEGPSPTYVVPASEATRRLYVEVIARAPWHEAGYASSTRVQVGDPAATNTAPPAVTPGAGRVGDTFTADPGTWTPASGVDELTYAYQWFVDGYHYADGETFVPDEGLEGSSIKVRVLVSAPGHLQARAVSVPVRLAPLPAVPWSTQPAVSGTPQVGKTLVLSPGTVAASLEPVTTVRWSVGGRARNANRGSAGLAYTPNANDLGKPVTVRVITSAPGYSDATWTASTAVVAPVGTVTAPTPTGTVAISGTPALGQSLKATPGSWSVAGLSFAYSWTVNGKVVATGGTFTVPTSAVGKLVAVVAQATKTGHPAGSATSAGVRIAKVKPVLSLKAGKATGKRTKKTRSVPVTLTVTAAGLAPTGTVTVRIGTKVVGRTTVSALGRSTLKLKLKKGKHRLVATYAGSATLTATSRTLTVKVR